MTITAAFVLYAGLWFIILFLVIQTTVRPQSETDEIVPGTHASAPADETVKRMMLSLIHI